MIICDTEDLRNVKGIYSDAIDLGACMRDSHVAAGILLLGEFTGKEFIEFSTEYTISDEFSFLADCSGHCEVWIRDQPQRYRKFNQAIHPIKWTV